MRDVVREAFAPFTVAFEGGFITWLFPDIEGKVSTGFGLLMEPVAIALTLPWRRADGSMASREDIVADWIRVKNHPNAPRLGHRSVEHVAKLRLDREGLYQAFQGKLGQHDAYLRNRFPDFDEWPADAQLATHSMAWACGPAFRFPKLEAALRVRDWLVAAVECHMNEWDEGVFNAGLVPRNVANRLLYRNAAFSDDPATLYYPRDLAAEPETVPDFRLDLLESEPPPPHFGGGIVYALPDPPKRELPVLHDDDDDDPDEAA